MDIENQQYVCNICEKTYSTQKTLNNHYQTHNKTESIKCDICAKEVSNTANLRKHMKDVHEKHHIAKATCEICQIS